MKVYIAGAITNNPNYMQQFADAEKLLTNKGHATLAAALAERIPQLLK